AGIALGLVRVERPAVTADEAEAAAFGAPADIVFGHDFALAVALGALPRTILGRKATLPFALRALEAWHVGFAHTVLPSALEMAARTRARPSRIHLSQASCRSS